MAKKTTARGRATTKKKKKSVKKINIKSRVLVPAVAVVLIAVAALSIVLIHNQPHRVNPFENVNADYLCGIDVSHHNGKINWHRVGKKIDFAIVRVGARGYLEGNIIKDRRADANLRGAIKEDIPVGVYFYTQATTPKEAEEEARFAVKAIRGYDVTLPVFIDFEYAYDKNGSIAGRLYEAGLTAEENTAIINAFCRVVERAGYQCGVYASSYIYKSHLNMSALNKNCFIWVADYNESVTYDGAYDVWQYSDKGSLKGIGSRHVDLNYWYLK